MRTGSFIEFSVCIVQIVRNAIAILSWPITFKSDGEIHICLSRFFFYTFQLVDRVRVCVCVQMAAFSITREGNMVLTKQFGYEINVPRKLFHVDFPFE